MLACVTYKPGFVASPAEAFKALWDDLDWERRGSTPRREYYCNEVGVSYTYGAGAGVREYLPKACTPFWRASRLLLKLSWPRSSRSPS